MNSPFVETDPIIPLSTMVKSKNQNKKKVVEVDVVTRMPRRRPRKPKSNGRITGYSTGGVVRRDVPGAMSYSIPRGMRMSYKNDIVRITKCELTQTVSGTSSAFFGSPASNPIMPASFPWLNGIAQNFSKFRFTRVTAKYTSQTGTATTGAIGLAWGYDFADGTSTTIGQVSAFDQFRLEPLWYTWDTPIVCDLARFENKWYPYTKGSDFAAIALPIDQNQRAPAYLVVYNTVSNPTSGIVGNIWLEYDVELCDPKSFTIDF